MKLRRIQCTATTFYITISLLTVFILLTDNNQPYFYNYLVLLPLCFGLLTLLFFNIFKDFSSNLGLMIIIGTYSIRYVFTPLIMAFGNYAGFINKNIEFNMSNAIVLMIYEILIVFIVIQFAINKNRRIKGMEIKRNNPINFRVSSIIFLILVIFNIAAIIIMPELKYKFSSLISSTGVSNFINHEQENSGGIESMIATFFIFNLHFIRVFASCLLITIIYKFFKVEIVRITLSFIVIALQFTFIPEFAAIAIFSAIISFLYMAKLYQSKKYIINWLSLFIVSLIIAVFFYGKAGANAQSNNILIFNEISILIQAYFSGPANIAGIFNMVDHNKLQSFFFDIYYAIPFNNTLFGLEGERSVYIYNSVNNIRFQIIPSIGQAYHYLGPIFAPILPALFAYFAVIQGEKLKKENNIWLFISRGMLVINLSLTPIAYNGTLFLWAFTNIIIPLYLLGRYSKPLYFSDIRGFKRLKKSFDDKLKGDSYV